MTEIVPTPDTISRLHDEFGAELAAAETDRALQAVRDRYLARKGGVIAGLMKSVAAAAPADRPALGKLTNDLKNDIEARISEKRAAVDASRAPTGVVDVSLPGRMPPLGHRHPLTVVRDQMEDIFTRMGFAIVEGPEVEDEWHCFDALNMPAEHPARDMQDTLYLAPPMTGDGGKDDVRTLLRTHTSSMQIRYMQATPPPVRIIVPGRVYRRDDLDLTHSPAFGQFEGLAVGEGISLADLKGTLLAFAQQMFSPTTRVRFRPSFFPYTEPSAEIDLSCWRCDGAGCAMCKKSGWIEIGGCGMVHPAVFEAVGYDAERYTGFAWGIGIERIAILRYRVEDIRLFYENDLRFLEQFPVLGMRLLISWARDFVDVTASPEEIAAKLSMRGFEVASIEPVADGDAVIDFEVTANRPDCLSVLGFARELSALYDLPLHRPAESGATIALRSTAAGDSNRIRVSVEETDLCPRYSAAIADITPGAASPAWLTTRLQAAGVRPISPIVDITNYVLIELGQPMHAFDLAKLAGAELRIRRAKRGELVTTLDGIERKLDPEMLVIADANRAQAVAGVMGGAASEVSGATTAVVFESAYFKPASVRRTSKRLGIKTEASSRFERGADVNVTVVALERAIALMDQLNAGRMSGPIVDRYPTVRQPAKLHLRRGRLAAVLGVSVPDGDVERILRRLGLEVKPTSNGWDVVAPTFRVDLVREVDLIEEVGRHHGFELLPSTFPPQTRPAAAPDPRIARDRLVRRVLTAAGLSEAVTFGFIEAKAARPFAVETESSLISIANPLSAKFDTLRASLLPGVVDSVAHNRRHGRADVGLFEIGARFSLTTGETRGVAVAWTGRATDDWKSGSRPVDFFDVKGAVERLCDALDVSVRFEQAAVPFLAPGQAAAVVAGGAPAGIVGLLAPAIAEGRGAPRQDEIFVAELSLDALWAGRTVRDEAIAPLPRYPFVVRDLSIVVADTLPAEIISGTIHSAARPASAPLVGVRFFDRYQGKGVPDGKVSLSVRLTFQAVDRTLIDADVQNSFDAIVAALVSAHGAVQR